MSKLIINKLNSLPEFLTSNHLVDLGLYNSIDAAYLARVNGNSPDFIQFKRKILYPKASLIQFIEEHMHLHDASLQKNDQLGFDHNNSI